MVDRSVTFDDTKQKINGTKSFKLFWKALDCFRRLASVENKASSQKQDYWGIHFRASSKKFNSWKTIFTLFEKNYFE